jgi:hypothetical protein
VSLSFFLSHGSTFHPQSTEAESYRN